MSDVRPMTAVPRNVVLLVVIAVVMQLSLTIALPRSGPSAAEMPHPPSSMLVRSLSFGEEAAAGKLTMLWLQSFDNQPGVSIPLAALDYGTVIAWLQLALALDPGAQYPLLAGARIYAEVPDEAKQREMLAFLEEEFLRDPNLRWRWMAHAVYLAKHRIGDLDLAQRYAEKLATYATGPNVPSWAQQMHIFIQEDMGELESAKVLLGGLLESGKITDPHEQWFLSQRLAELEARLSNGGQE